MKLLLTVLQSGRRMDYKHGVLVEGVMRCFQARMKLIYFVGKYDRMLNVFSLVS